MAHVPTVPALDWATTLDTERMLKRVEARYDVRGEDDEAFGVLGWMVALLQQGGGHRAPRAEALLFELERYAIDATTTRQVLAARRALDLWLAEHDGAADNSPCSDATMLRDIAVHRTALTRPELLLTAGHIAARRLTERVGFVKTADLLRCCCWPLERRQWPDRPTLKAVGAVDMAELAQAEEAWDRLPVLADLLEEHGCEDAAALKHLRGGGPHVKACHCLRFLTPWE